MKLTNFVLLIAMLGSAANASMEYRAGRNYMWSERANGTVGTTIYGEGYTSFETMNAEDLKNRGYSQTIKSVKQDKWKHEKNGTTGSVTINRRGPRSFESIISEGKENGVDWTDISVFGEGNTLTRRTICKDLDCYVVSKSICTQMSAVAGVRDATEAKAIAKTCQAMSDTFTFALRNGKNSQSIEKDFNSDIQKVSNTWRSKKMNLGEANTLGAQNLFGYLQACSEMEWYNKANVETVSSPATPGTTGGRTRQLFLNVDTD